MILRATPRAVILPRTAGGDCREWVTPSGAGDCCWEMKGTGEGENRSFRYRRRRALLPPAARSSDRPCRSPEPASTCCATIIDTLCRTPSINLILYSEEREREREAFVFFSVILLRGCDPYHASGRRWRLRVAGGGGGRRLRGSRRAREPTTAAP